MREGLPKIYMEKKNFLIIRDIRRVKERIIHNKTSERIKVNGEKKIQKEKR